MTGRFKVGNFSLPNRLVCPDRADSLEIRGANRISDIEGRRLCCNGPLSIRVQFLVTADLSYAGDAGVLDSRRCLSGVLLYSTEPSARVAVGVFARMHR